MFSLHDLTLILYSESFIKDHVVDSILWFAFLYHLNSPTSSSSAGSSHNRLQLKMKGSSSIMLSSTDMRDLCVKGTVQVCKQMMKALETTMSSMDVRIEQQGGGGDGNNVFFCAMNDFTTLSNCLSQVNALRQYWIVAMSDDKDQVRGLLSKVLKSLTDFQKKHNNNKVGIHDVKCNQETIKEKSKESNLKRNFGYGADCDKIRSAAKFLLLSLENAGSSNTIGMSSKTD